MTPADVKSVIESEDDFGHEMRVGNEFQKAANIPHDIFWPARIVMLKHGETYVDPITSKDRQFDYRCEIRFGDGTPQPHEFSVLLAVECKNLHTSSPLVVCGRGRTYEEAYHTIVRSKWSGHAAMSPTSKTVENSRFYSADSFVGKSLVRLKDERGKLKTDPQADVYDRWSQAVTSGKEMAKEACSFADKCQCSKYSSLVLPIVVVPDGLLWTVTYDNTGQIKTDPALVDQCEFFIASQTELCSGNPPLVLTHIHFVTIKGFATLLHSFLGSPRETKNVIFPFNIL